MTATVGLPTAVSEVLLLKDLDILIPIPASVTSGTKNFTVTVDAQPRQDLTNPAAVYTASLGGVSFNVPAAGGTVTVAVPVTAGGTIRLQHTLNHSGTDMRDIFEALFGANVPVFVPYLAYASAMQLVCPQISRVEPAGGWTPSTASNVCTNPVYAIRAVTATVTQSAFGYDASIAATGSGNITFSRPNSDRICVGLYTVAYTVALNGYQGDVKLRVGDQVVYAATGGAAIYQWTPCTVQIDTDVDVLPVKLDGGAGTVVVSITSASRTVGTGNLEGSRYASLAYPSTRYFRALQVDSNPDLGTITSAKLAVEWFGNGIIPANTVQVKWAGRRVGYLEAQSLGGQSINKTITTSITAQGQAALPTQNISTSVAKTDNSVNVAVSAPLSYTPKQMGDGVTWSFPLNTRIGLPLGVVAGNYTFTMRFNPCAEILKSGSYQSGSDYVQIGSSVTAINKAISAATDISVSVSLSENQQYLTIKHLRDSGLDGLGWFHDVITEFNPTAVSIYGVVATRPTYTALSVSGSSLPLAAQNLSNSGISVGTQGGNISITIPDAPRTTVTTFDLPDVRQWSDMTGKTAEIEILSASPSVQLLQVQLVVEYDSVTRSVPESMTATVNGMSGNPADVIEYLAGKIGYRLAVMPLRNFRAWCVSSSYRFARRIAQESDALQLLQFALEQANAILAPTDEGMAVIRLLDVSTQITAIAEGDLLEPPTLGWSERIETAVTLKYREDYVGSSGWLKTRQIDETNSVYCVQAKSARKLDNPVTIEAGWIREDTVAMRYLGDYSRLYCQPTRIARFYLPYSFAILQAGDLVEYSDVLYRINSINRPDGFVELDCREIPR